MTVDSPKPMQAEMPAASGDERAVLLILFLALFVGTADTQIFSPYLPILAKSFNTTPGVFGRVVAIYSVCAASAALMAGVASDVRGHALFLKVGVGLFTIASLVTAYAGSVQTFIFLRGLTGLAAGAISACTISYAADYFPYKTRGRAMGIIMASYFAAATIGVVALAKIADSAGWRAGYQVLGGTACIAFILLMILMPNRSAEEPQISVSESSGAILRPAVVYMFILAFLVSGGLTTFLVYIGSYLSETFHRTTSEIAMIFLVGGATAVIAAPAAGKIADATGKRPLIIGGNIAMAAFFFIIPRMQWGLKLFVIFGLASLAAALRQGPFQAFTTAVIGRQRRGLLVALRNVCSQLGIAFGALIGGNLYNRVGGFELVASFCVIMTIVACVPVLFVKEPSQDGC